MTVKGAREFLKKEAKFEVEREKLSFELLGFTPEWSPFYAKHYEVLNSKIEKRKYRSRLHIKRLEEVIERQKDPLSKSYLEEFNNVVFDAGRDMAENNFLIEREKKKKLSNLKGSRKVVDILFKAASAFTTGEITYFHFGHLPSLGTAIISIYVFDEIQKKWNSYQINKLEEKRKSFVEKRIKEAILDTAEIFKEHFPYAVKGLESSALEILVDLESLKCVTS